MKTWTDATLCSHHCDHTGNSMSLYDFKWKPVEVNSHSHLWKHAASLNIICWILRMIKERRWPHGGNAGGYSVCLDIAWPHRTPHGEAFICWILQLQMSLRHDKLHVWTSFTAFCDVLTSDESHPLTIHGALLLHSLLSEGSGSLQSSGTLSALSFLSFVSFGGRC